MRILQIAFILQTPIYGAWSIPLDLSKPGKPGVQMSADLVSWGIKGVSVLLCSYLLLKSGNSLKNEHYQSAFLAMLAATIVAIAPEILTSMFY